MTGPFKPRMNKEIYIRRACFCPALDFGAGNVIAIASVAKLPDLLKQVCLAVSSPGGHLWEEGCQRCAAAETWSRLSQNAPC